MHNSRYICKRNDGCFHSPPAMPVLTYSLLLDLWPSDQPVGVEVTVNCSDPYHQSQDTSSSLTASPCVSDQMHPCKKKKENVFSLKNANFHKDKDQLLQLIVPGCSPQPSKTQNRQEEEGEEEKQGEEEVCSREQRGKRLNDLLLTLQHS